MNILGLNITRTKNKFDTKFQEKEPQTTAPQQFDVTPDFSRYRQMLGPQILKGYYYEVRDAWKMYRTDDRIGTSIDSIAEDCTPDNRNGRPFNINVTRKAGEFEDKANELAEKLHQKFIDLDLYFDITNILKYALLEGSTFHRTVIDLQNNEICELRDIAGPQKGFMLMQMSEGQFAKYWTQFEFMSQKIVTVLAPWEVIRFDWNKRKDDNYGMGLFMRSRKNWTKLEESEENLQIARDERAYPRYDHRFPNATIEELQKVRADEENERKRQGKRDVEQDIYTTGGTNVLEASNTALFNINDIEYRQRKLFAGGRRPVALMGGYGKDAANKAVLDRQEHRYVSGFLSDVRKIFSRGIKSLVDMQLLLWGYLPGDWNVIYEWPRLSVEDKRALGVIAKDGVDRMALPQSVYSQLFDLDPKEVQNEVEEDLARRAELENKYIIPVVDEGFGQ